MYAIGKFAELVSIIYAGIGIFMAHTLYRSPRKKWQCLLAWIGIVVACTAVGEVLNVLLPQFTEQRIAIFTGCSFILVYIYLFPNIPLPQRIFTYFLADTCMYLLLLLTRTATMLAVQYLGISSTVLFPILYLSAAAGFCLFYLRWFRAMILRGLSGFSKDLRALTLFAATCYLGTLFLIDAWKPWPALTIFAALAPLGLVAINISGYVLAFRALTVVGQRLAAESEAKMAQLQLTLAEKEYHATMEGMDQVRRMRHDMNHHLTALSALVAEGDTAGAQAYIAKAAELLPRRALSGENPITGSFIERYRTLCQESSIVFSAEIAYHESPIANKAHLGILLGNALQNAYDGARTAQGDGRFVSVEGRQIHDNLVFVIKNGFSGALDSGLNSTKGEGHGLGLSSMRSVVEEYDGYLDTRQENGVFTLHIVLAFRV
ncbi:MAG: GHKL domain-containing protein [Oscillospiraceae bacterium]